MAASTTFEQKHLSTRLRYTFDDEVLRAEIEDASHQTEYTIPYVEIPFESTRYTAKMEALRGGAIFFLIIAALSGFGAFSNLSLLAAMAIQLGLAVACWVGYKRLRATYTLLDTERGRLMILDNEDHDMILGEIESRRRVMLRDAFAEVNLDNDPTHEVRKFEWLRRNGIISDAEFKDRVSEIEGKPQTSLPGPKTVH